MDAYGLIMLSSAPLYPNPFSPSTPFDPNSLFSLSPFVQPDPAPGQSMTDDYQFPSFFGFYSGEEPDPLGQSLPADWNPISFFNMDFTTCMNGVQNGTTGTSASASGSNGNGNGNGNGASAGQARKDVVPEVPEVEEMTTAEEEHL